MAVIVTYNPDDRLLRSIHNIIHDVTAVVVVDNASETDIMCFFDTNNPKYPNIHIMRFDTNRGLAYALNTGVSFAIQKYAPDYVLTLDQDTIVLPNILSTLFMKLKLVVSEKLGCISLMALEELHDCYDFINVNYAMGSGCFVKSDVYSRVRYREDFFMDLIDHDFSYELRKLGYNILLFTHKAIEHKLGRKFSFITYEPGFRVYYIVRNSTILLRERKMTLFTYLRYVVYFPMALAITGQLLSSLHSTLSGIIDGMAGRVGLNNHFVPDTQKAL